jgi:hypothetical protein
LKIILILISSGALFTSATHTYYWLQTPIGKCTCSRQKIVPDTSCFRRKFKICNSAVIIIVSDSTVVVRPLVASHRRFRNLFWHLVRFLWTSDQPVAKASTYTGQNNI